MISGSHNKVFVPKRFDRLGFHRQVAEAAEGGDLARGGAPAALCHRGRRPCQQRGRPQVQEQRPGVFAEGGWGGGGGERIWR